MRASFDVVRFAEADGLLHDEGVAGVEAAGDIGVVDKRDEVFIGAAGEVAVGFAEVDVDLDGDSNGWHCEVIVDSCWAGCLR